MIRRRLIVTGRVQGVFYRAWFVDQARGWGLMAGYATAPTRRLRQCCRARRRW